MKEVIALFSLLLFLNGCAQKPPSSSKTISEKQLQEELIEVNRMRTRNEMNQLREFIAQEGWQMDSTATGLFFTVLFNGDTAQPVQLGSLVTLDYLVYTPSKDTLYSSANSGPRTFEVGRADVESGLHEAVQLLHAGDSARVILPSHLAYGLSGDGAKVRQRTPLIYELAIRKVSN